MIRYVVTYQQELRAEHVAHIREQLAAAANAKEWRDVVLSGGAYIADMRQNAARVRMLVKRARSRAR